MRLDVKEIQKEHIFGNKSFRAIGENLGVTKQYLSFICNDKKANSEKVFKELLDEFESTKNNYSVFDRIRIKRKLLNVTQKAAADEVGTHASVVTRIENGELPHSIFVQRLADYLEV
tara:strand:- start:135 stop:485 length:351 start_codon:yes stop_codon:yes gene_type:complete